MKYHAIVPVKSLDEAKSRLAKSLTASERKRVVLLMVDHVLSILQSVKEITKISVVTPDETVRKQAKKKGITILTEEKPGYNPSLTAAMAKDTDSHALLTIAADLPLLTLGDIEKLIDLSLSHEVVLAPSKDNGTNALLLRSPLLVPYLFGINSFEKYRKYAEKKNLSVGIYTSDTIAFDVDTPEDLARMQKQKLSLAHSYRNITLHKEFIK